LFLFACLAIFTFDLKIAVKRSYGEERRRGIAVYHLFENSFFKFRIFTRKYVLVGKRKIPLFKKTN
jgi:fatty acid desaturase